MNNKDIEGTKPSSKNDTPKNSLPLDEEIIAYLTQRPSAVSKQELAKYFKVQGREPRQLFKKQLLALVKKDLIKKEKGRNFSAGEAGKMPAVIRVKILEFNEDRFCFIAEPYDVHENAPKFVYIRQKDLPKARENDFFLVRLEEKNKKYWGNPLKRIFPELDEIVCIANVKPTHSNQADTADLIMLTPTNRRIKDMFYLKQSDHQDINNRDLVTISAADGDGAKFVANLGPSDDISNVSLIAMHEHGMRIKFPGDVVELAEKADLPPLSKTREDFRDLPLVTIDGEDARDFDDAVYAYFDTDAKLWRLHVAIADVSYYVRYNDALDKEALKRGNSTYFPDRVIPMLPEALSNGLCSLNPDVDRACMMIVMSIDEHGQLKNQKIKRGLMKSKARLTYTQVQHYIDGETKSEMIGDVSKVENHIQDLHTLYKILRKAREKRGALDIHGSEQKIIFGDDGKVKELGVRVQLEAHKLIEECMVLANVAAATLLEAKQAPCIYRVHDKPAAERLTTLKTFLDGFGYNFEAKGDIQPSTLNNILKKSAGKIEQHAINETVLRTQCQAQYTPDNIGHFGLALDRYAHFTSPIRRYADLIVHRSLVRAYKLDEKDGKRDGLTDEQASRLEGVSEIISTTERTSSRCERDTTSRMTALYLEAQDEKVFDAQISGVSDFGLFVRLPQFGAEGLIPMRKLPNDYYVNDEKTKSLRGRRSGRIYQFLATMRVRLLEIDPLLNSILFKPEDEKSAVLEGFKFKFPVQDDRRGGGNRTSKRERTGSSGKDKGKPKKTKKYTANKFKSRKESFKSGKNNKNDRK